MGANYSSLCLSTATQHHSFPVTTFHCKEKSKSIFSFNPNHKDQSFVDPLKRIAYFPQTTRLSRCGLPSKIGALKGGKVRDMESQEAVPAITKPLWDLKSVDEGLVQQMIYDALVWSSLHGLVVGDKNIQVSFEYLFYLKFVSLYMYVHSVAEKN